MEDQFSHVASLIGDPIRSKILWALLDGRAYTATELAIFADTSAQNISMHLNKLVKAELLTVESQGRHRYYNYARPDIPYAIEAIANLIPGAQRAAKPHLEDKPVRHCRSCYDHLAGKVGVLLTEALIDQQFLIKQDSCFEVSHAGEEWFGSFGIDTRRLREHKRSFARPCLDWSERRHHVAGALGAALLDQMISNSWIRRMKDSRAMIVTLKGKQALHDNFRIEL